MKIALPSFALRQMSAEEILGSGADHMEIGFETMERTLWLRALCEDNGLSFSVHVPSTHHRQTPLPNFSPTSPVRFRALDALALTRATMEMWAWTGATHVVIHYPSANDFDPSEHRIYDNETATWFLGELCRMSRDMDLPVCLENLSVNDGFCLSQHYEPVLQAYPELGFCFDVGHAWLAGGMPAVDGFVDRLGARTLGVHLYDYRMTGGRRIKAPFSLNGETCYGSLANLMARLAPVLEHAVVIHEAASREGPAALRASIALLKRTLDMGTTAHV